MPTITLSDADLATIQRALEAALRPRAVTNHRFNTRHERAALAALVATAKVKPLPTRPFTRGGFSFRPVIMRNNLMSYHLFRKGDRSMSGNRGSVDETKGGCFIHHPRNGYANAFHTFWEAVDFAVDEARP